MLYLLDANVLIDANRDYYTPSAAFQNSGTGSWTVLPSSRPKYRWRYTRRSLREAEDHLTRWVKDNRGTLLLKENVDVGLVARVTASGYAPDLDDEEIQRLGRDPFLIAYALCDSVQRIVVTTEVSKPSKERANRRIPDVCRILACFATAPSISSRRWTSPPVGDGKAIL